MTTPLHSRLSALLAERNRAAAEVKAELHAVAGTEATRLHLNGLRQQYTEANDHFCDLMLANAEEILAALADRDHLAGELAQRTKECQTCEGFELQEREARRQLKEAGVDATLAEVTTVAHGITVLRADRDRLAGENKNLLELLRLVYPHIPNNAIDREKAENHRVAECYLRNMVGAVLFLRNKDTTK
jgi:DNA-binding transcriptional ArsR family regulator